jgi:glutamyl-tRNA synthetase
VNNRPVRVRFAPSPTGELHVGGARTALFNWLYAHHHQGEFYLRIEDTDRERSREEYVQQILDSLTWLGLTWDGPPVFQSQRLKLYQKAVQQLLEKGKAYRCFCTPQELAAQRASQKDLYQYPGTCRTLTKEEQMQRLNQGQSFAVRLKIPEGTTTFEDLIYGKISVDHRELDDFIIARTGGIPTYNLVVVVDDHAMKITHVIRGEDHISNTPKQILIYQAMGFELPQFAHLPMIWGPDKKRLSKRHGATGVQTFRQQGYIAQGLLNYLALLGWNSDTEGEIFNLSELVNLFHIRQIQKKPAVFNEQKLLWVNGQHIFRSTPEELLDQILTLVPDWRSNEDRRYLLQVIEMMKLRAKTLRDFITSTDYFFADPTNYDANAVQKRWKGVETNHLVQTYLTRLKALSGWEQKELEATLRSLTEEWGLSAGKLIHPVRLAISGVPHGPSLFAMMELLGRETCLRRISAALERLPDNP